MSASVSPFRAAPGSPKFPELEQEVLKFWDDNDVYHQSLRRRRDCPSFVFYEGPPTANGLPHPGHCLTRAIKDLFPRYKTMRGYRCQRKAGWDTHGLPVEVEVGKELGIHSKEEIEAYGVEPFIQMCQQSVWRYMREWETLTRRIGFWVDLEQAYVTYHQSYVESVWWSLKNLFDRGLLYEGHKIVWWWAQGGTALSAGEVGQGYREVADPSVYVLFPLVDQPGRSLVVWTTTPWTLPSNMFAAVHPELEYSVVRDDELDTEFVIASVLLETIAAKLKRELPVVETVSGKSLVGLRYEPPFADYRDALGDPVGELVGGGRQHKYWRVIEADFVTTDSGSGVVHQAPAFGEVDHDVLVAERARFSGDGLDLLCSVGPDGKFTDEFPEMKGTWVKDADKPLTRSLRDAGKLLLQEQYLHEYPFCWRADDDPLIQYPRRSWFIRTTTFRDLMLKNNSQIGWLPEHIRDGRFGNFLESNVDWALSRERYWGTPLPIWVCQQTGEMEAIGNYQELLGKPGLEGTEVWAKAKADNPHLVDDLRVHKPYIDAVSYDSPFADGARMQRVPDVIDCWYDSGAMPFAQWGWPHQNDDRLKDQFPADFISEALDQTRGWFYSQLAISTMLFGEGASITQQGVDHPVDDGGFPPLPYPHPFRNCIVLGLMLGEDGQKMSKSKRNYREPNEIFDKYGADALRWFFFAGQPPWTAIQYREQSIKNSIPEFLLRTWNVFSFFTIYAEIDGFDPTTATGADQQLTPESLATAPTYRPVSERSEIDRWILSELNQTITVVTERMDAFDNYNACQAINAFVDGLSNWHVRRSRDRFWAGETDSSDKQDAYWTLYESLLELSKLIAPFVPFLAETLWQRLLEPFAAALPSGGEVLKSVHWCDYPTARVQRIDRELSESMKLLREIASLGRAARADAKLKVRLPLSRVEVVLADDSKIAWLTEHNELVREELNVKAVEYTTDGDQYVQYTVVPNFKRLGPKVGKQVPAVKQALAEADGNTLLTQLQKDGQVTIDLPDGSLQLDGEDIEVRLQAREGWAAAQGLGSVVVLNTEVTDELRREGLAKDLIRIVQNQRKDIGCEYTDRIEIGVATEDSDSLAAIKAFEQMICSETLAVRLVTETIPGADPVETDSGAVYVKKVAAS